MVQIFVEALHKTPLIETTNRLCGLLVSCFKADFCLLLVRGITTTVHTVILPRQTANAQCKLHRGATLPPCL